MLDSILLFLLASTGTFIALNYNSPYELAIVSVSAYPFLLFFLAGNFRCMMVFCLWKPWQVVVYKLVKFNAALFYLGYGIFSSIQNPPSNPELYLLFIFTTFGFYAELIARFNALDQSDNLIPTLKLKNDEHANLLP
eukprot:GHVR01068711.1.p2 GENE.GHVR01068711.1~~GHVR01068711.1.p2  ORF type:complete len:137 (-),score=4.20 GHVR01068711.1:91-501(-)